MPRDVMANCPTCMQRDCGHVKGQPGCGHYFCHGDVTAELRHSCPGIPLAMAAVKAQADSIKNTVMAGVSPEARAAVHRLQRDGLADAEFESDLGTALTGIMDAFPAPRRRRRFR
jgi:hypothetical protein